MDGHPAWKIGLSGITNRNIEVFGVLNKDHDIPGQSIPTSS